VLYGVGTGGIFRSLNGSDYWGEPDFLGPLEEIGGSGPADVWVAGPGTLAHFDGGTWGTVAALSSGHFWGALWVAGPGDVWAFGRRSGPSYNNPIVHFDGVTWSEVSSPVLKTSMSAAWGAAPNDGWAVGPAGAMLRWDGGEWSHYSQGSEDPDYTSVAVTAPGEAWVFSNTRFPRRFTPQGVSTLDFGDGGPKLAVGSAVGPTDVWAGNPDGFSPLMHFDGRAWTPVASPLWGIHAIHGTSRYRWAMSGSAGTLWRYDERGLNMERLNALIVYYGVFVAPDGEAWAVGTGGAIARSRSTSGSWAPVASPTSTELRAVWGARTDDVWAVGGNQFLHWNGSAWSVAAMPDAGSTVFTGLWGSAADDLWAIGSDGTESVAAHFDGGMWSLLPLGISSRLSALHGAGTEVWAVGSNGAVLRR
jgi:hypothetical protein